MLQSLKRYRVPLLTVCSVLFLDQFIKIYIKLHYPLGEVGRLANWCIIHFTENPGMAFGFEFGGTAGKLALSVFRILACAGGALYIRHIILKKEHWGFIFAVSLILAGAMGNILDSAFYGMLFDKGTLFNSEFNEYMPYDGIARMNGNGYAPAMFGCVVDMFYFPVFNGSFPNWVPIWGGEEFQFFRPIFNLADASISFGVAIILLFQNVFSRNARRNEQASLAENQTNGEDLQSNENLNQS
ncbi:MAG TPA: lipoprotein signal peptidase [Bacteroidia bacterium]|nr:lipoprotein signal peptidase [Bacteroidia bacterium]